MRKVQKQHKNYWSLGCVLLVWLCMGCESFTEVSLPDTQVTTEQVFDSDESALLAVTGIYIGMTDNLGHFANKNTTEYAGLSADEFENLSSTAEKVALYENELLPSNVLVSGLWNEMYQTIYRANAVIVGLSENASVSEDLKTQLLGEVYFIRAFAHLYLTNFFGAVPYVTSTDYRENSTVSRMTVPEVYAHIITDLEAAISRLAEEYSLSDGERIRPNVWAAKALLARVYLYQENWEQARMLATEIIQSGASYTLEPLNEVFLADSQEAIWQLYPTIEGLNTIEGYSFTCCVTSNFRLSNGLVSAFEVGDNRLTQWVGDQISGSENFYYPFKYQQLFTASPVEYYTVLRLAEQYLIRAEAAAQLGLLSEATTALNTIRLRAGLGETTATTSETLLTAIAQERRIELFAEWGHRWFDLKRTNALEVLESKPNWQATDVLYPIPESERLLNSNLTQNMGY